MTVHYLKIWPDQFGLGREIEVWVTSILKAPSAFGDGLKKGYCIMSIRL